MYQGLISSYYKNFLIVWEGFDGQSSTFSLLGI